MNDLAKELKSQYGYTSYELALVKYALVSILSELSKLFILGIFLVDLIDLSYQSQI